MLKWYFLNLKPFFSSGNSILSAWKTNKNTINTWLYLRPFSLLCWYIINLILNLLEWIKRQLWHLKMCYPWQNQQMDSCAQLMITFMTLSSWALKFEIAMITPFCIKSKNQPSILGYHWRRIWGKFDFTSALNFSIWKPSEPLLNLE